MNSNNLNQENQMLTENRSGIITHPREIMDLRELFVILTYSCNGNCEYCIERNVHQKGMISDENFEKALAFAETTRAIEALGEAPQLMYSLFSLVLNIISKI